MTLVQVLGTLILIVLRLVCSSALVQSFGNLSIDPVLKTTTVIAEHFEYDVVVVVFGEDIFPSHHCICCD